VTAATSTWTAVAAPVSRRPAIHPPWFHVVDGDRPLVWLVEASQLFQVTPDFLARVRAQDRDAVDMLRQAAVDGPPPPAVAEVTAEPRAISLALAQACNLSCSYCYADEGRFGGSARRMTPEVARRAVDALLDGAGGRPVTLGFLGGEVLLHRDALHDVVRYAAAQARERGVTLRFSITTNATLVTPADVALFRDHPFTVTVSLDGGAATNDAHRHARSGEGSFARSVTAMAPLLADPGRSTVVARSTVTRDDLRVHERVQELGSAGFGEIGVSPLRTGPDLDLRLRAEDWAPFLREMIRAADSDLARVDAGGRPRFANLSAALREIHRGSARSLPCGSAGDYVAVGAGGEYWSCHRTVDDARYRLGALDEGLSRAARSDFIRTRSVDSQEPCRSCWARYLCGGGCHAEVGEVGRAGCDYIRGWLEYCISMYSDCLTDRPEVLRAMGVTT